MAPRFAHTPSGTLDNTPQFILRITRVSFVLLLLRFEFLKVGFNDEPSVLLLL